MVLTGFRLVQVLFTLCSEARVRVRTLTSFGQNLNCFFYLFQTGFGLDSDLLIFYLGSCLDLSPEFWTRFRLQNSLLFCVSQRLYASDRKQAVSVADGNP
ncbi:hypothetical protein ATANTOWER_003420 [Ataeniobius toweri]|uniref:Secreted protein n=1 Tax=Ataeniobius toweri TaxID=208326 RepID=A0ABU7BNB2_9TELE|nr:hypothetical protein [Ataeniobius toweri]